MSRRTPWVVEKVGTEQGDDLQKHLGEYTSDRINHKAGGEAPALSCAALTPALGLASDFASALLQNGVDQLQFLVQRAGKRSELFHDGLRVDDGDPPGKLTLHFLGLGVMYDDLIMGLFAFNGTCPLSNIRIKLYAAATVMYSRLTVGFIPGSPAPRKIASHGGIYCW